MTKDMTTSVPVINTAHLEGRNHHLIPRSSFWTEVIKTWGICQIKTNCVCTQKCKNLRVIIFLTLTVTHDILEAVYSLKRKAVRMKKASLWKLLIFYSQHFNVALNNLQYIHTLLTFKLSSLRISIRDLFLN